MPLMLLVNSPDPEGRELWAAVFGELGFRVIATSDAMPMLINMAENPPAVAIIDAILPDGFDLLQQVKALFPALSVVLLTRSADAADRERAKELGADDMLVDPFDIEDLVESVQKICPVPTVVVDA